MKKAIKRASSAKPGKRPPVDRGGEEIPFWQRKSLEEMNAAEWESLCDGCGRCCLNKLEDEDTGAIEWTSVSCRLLDTKTCRCSDYDHRQSQVPDCIGLTAETVRSLTWLPVSCAYRLIAEERDLYWWHPLISGDAESVHSAGISVRGKTISETFVAVSGYEHFIVDWPNEMPGGSE